MNRGAQLLRDSGLTQEEIASAVGKSHVSVGHWLRGRSLPDAETRKKLRILYGIAAADWGRPPEPETVTAAAAPSATLIPPPVTAGPVSALTMARDLSHLCQQMFTDIAQSTDIRQRASVAKSLSSCIAQLAKVTNEYGGPERFYGTPIYLRLVEAIRKGCKDHEDAAKAIEDELRALDAEFGSE